MKTPPSADFLELVITEETAVLIGWQRHAHALAVELKETLHGWTGAAHYLRTGEGSGFGGLFDVPRGPCPSREAAIRNTVAHLVHHMLKMGLSRNEALRIYRVAGVPIPFWLKPESEPRGSTMANSPSEAAFDADVEAGRVIPGIQ